MRILGITVGTAMALCLMLAPLDAASKGKGRAPARVSSPQAPKAPKTTPSPKTAKTTAKVTKAPKVTTAAKATKGPKTAKTTAKVTKAPKATTTAKATSTTRTKTKTATTSEAKLAKAETRSAKKSSSASTTTPTTGTIDFTTGKVGEKLTRNTQLAEKLRNKLTAMGYTGDVFQAAYGFKNFGQFNAAVNNAQNHSLPFEQLKTLMTGVSVDAAGVVLYANRNPDGTVTMVPRSALTNPAPTTSLGQAKKTIASSVVQPTTARTTVKR